MKRTSRLGKYRTIFPAISLIICSSSDKSQLIFHVALTSLQNFLLIHEIPKYSLRLKKLRYWKFPVSLPILVNVLVSVSTFAFTFGDGNFHYDSLILFSITDRVIIFLLQILYLNTFGKCPLVHQ